MEPKTFKQFGTVSVAILLPLFLFFIGLLIIKSGFKSDPSVVILSFVAITFLICLLVFYQITITVDASSVSFKLGIGLFGKQYRISDIQSCKAVKNSAFVGIGIRMLPNGWLYNVSGLYAVELQFKNRSSVVRIGTDKPDEVAAAINSLIKTGSSEGNLIAERRKRLNPMWIVAIIILFVPLTLLISSKQEVNVFTNQEGLVIEGIYGLTIPYDNLLQVDTIGALPGIGIRTNGYALGKTKIGNFRLKDRTNVKLYVKSGFPPYILIQAKESKPIYINFENRQKTIDLYNELVSHKK